MHIIGVLASSSYAPDGDSYDILVWQLPPHPPSRLSKTFIKLYRDTHVNTFLNLNSSIGDVILFTSLKANKHKDGYIYDWMSINSQDTEIATIASKLSHKRVTRNENVQYHSSILQTAAAYDSQTDITATKSTNLSLLRSKKSITPITDLSATWGTSVSIKCTVTSFKVNSIESSFKTQMKNPQMRTESCVFAQCSDGRSDQDSVLLTFSKNNENEKFFTMLNTAFKKQAAVTITNLLSQSLSSTADPNQPKFMKSFPERAGISSETDSFLSISGWSTIVTHSHSDEKAIKVVESQSQLSQNSLEKLGGENQTQSEMLTIVGGVVGFVNPLGQTVTADDDDEHDPNDIIPFFIDVDASPQKFRDNIKISVCGQVSDDTHIELKINAENLKTLFLDMKPCQLVEGCKTQHVKIFKRLVKSILLFQQSGAIYEIVYNRDCAKLIYIHVSSKVVI